MDFIDLKIMDMCERYVSKWLRDAQLPVCDGVRFSWHFIRGENRLKIVYNSMIKYVDYDEIKKAS